MRVFRIAGALIGVNCSSITQDMTYIPYISIM
jgi:hypothetical protein